MVSSEEGTRALLSRRQSVAQTVEIPFQGFHKPLVQEYLINESLNHIELFTLI